MATTIPHNPSKRLHEDAINQDKDLLQSASIKRPRVISPRSTLSDSITNVEVFPDAIDLPEDIHQRRKHGLDALFEEDNEYNSEDELEVVDNLASGQPSSCHCRQRRRIDDDSLQNDVEGTIAHRLMLPPDIIRKIPEVVLDSRRHPHFTKITANKSTTLPQSSSGPLIEEIPYNPLALVPYSPPPLIFFPGLSNGAYAQGRDTGGSEMLTSTQEEEEDGVDRNVDAMEVLPMLTPPDAGFMLGPWTVNSNTANCDENGGEDAMEE
ncbi:hypothetical protein NADE_003553 [Nannochloris sp. 'desiccata']|nr:hypothetical protein KSW81_000422 [Chlorella desiccata (nom. nud.)]KAH7620944.1 hypothetical protein NADE_003553 [Chlorella desiccata (nom. nud.)]